MQSALFKWSMLLASIGMLAGAADISALPDLRLPQTHPACPPADFPRQRLDALKAQDFALENAADRERLVLALLPCLDHPDPALRDGIAFEAFSTWLRADQIDTPTRRVMVQTLLPKLRQSDEVGVSAPFAALVLAELARSDHMSPWLEAGERSALVDAAVDYLENVDDYRGFETGVGWRHGVAHGADLVLQLALNPELEASALDRLSQAITAQVAPSSGHPYIHGESMRLARALFHIARRNLRSSEHWTALLNEVASPAPLPNWGAAFESEAGLAKRHNTLDFLSHLYLLVQESGNADVQAALLPGLRAALRRLP